MLPFKSLNHCGKVLDSKPKSGHPCSIHQLQSRDDFLPIMSRTIFTTGATSQQGSAVVSAKVLNLPPMTWNSLVAVALL